MVFLLRVLLAGAIAVVMAGTVTAGAATAQVGVAAASTASSGIRGAVPIHAKLTAASPADGSTVATAREVRLTFNEEPNEQFVQMTVDGPGGSVAEGEPVVKDRTLTQALVADLPPGEHTATYRIVSVDGHPVSGTVRFTTTATAGSSASPTSSPSATSPTDTPSSVTSTPMPTPSAAPATAPASDDAARPWAWVVAAGLLVLVALAVGAAVTRRRGAARAG
ncbi:MAG: copper resistance CopC family protein [Phycicoccus sp.]